MGDVIKFKPKSGPSAKEMRRDEYVQQLMVAWEELPADVAFAFAEALMERIDQITSEIVEGAERPDPPEK